MDAIGHIGTIRITAMGSVRLELRRQHQEHEHHRQHEGEDRGVAGAQLLVGERGPFVAEAFGQRFDRELFHDRHRLPPGCTGRGAIELGGRIEIVARPAVRPGGVAHRRERAERYGVAAGVANTDGQHPWWSCAIRHWPAR
jgi:hypothetical protein